MEIFESAGDVELYQSLMIQYTLPLVQDRMSNTQNLRNYETTFINKELKIFRVFNLAFHGR